MAPLFVWNRLAVSHEDPATGNWHFWVSKKKSLSMSGVKCTSDFYLSLRETRTDRCSSGTREGRLPRAQAGWSPTLLPGLAVPQAARFAASPSAEREEKTAKAGLHSACVALSLADREPA